MEGAQGRQDGSTQPTAAFAFGLISSGMKFDFTLRNENTRISDPAFIIASLYLPQAPSWVVHSSNVR
jgi:hypothetical protein